MANPFDLTYDALWAMVEAHEGIDDIVKVGNRIKLDNQDPMKTNISAADLPELILVPSDGVFNFRNTSSTTMMSKNYEWLLSTGEIKLAGKLNIVEWMLFTTHLNWPQKFSNIKFIGENFVKRLQIISSRTGLADAERNRGVKGWSSIWRLQIDMYFKTSDLLLENTTTTTTSPP